MRLGEVAFDPAIGALDQLVLCDGGEKARRVRPLVSESRTASRRNSGVGLFPRPIEHLLVPQLVLSTKPGQVQTTAAAHRRFHVRTAVQ